MDFCCGFDGWSGMEGRPCAFYCAWQPWRATTRVHIALSMGCAPSNRVAQGLVRAHKPQKEACMTPEGVTHLFPKDFSCQSVRSHTRTRPDRRGWWNIAPTPNKLKDAFSRSPREMHRPTWTGQSAGEVGQITNPSESVAHKVSAR